MELTVLEPEVAEHLPAWISPEGVVFSSFMTPEEAENSLFKQLTGLNFDDLMKIAEMICKRKKYNLRVP